MDDLKILRMNSNEYAWKSIGMVVVVQRVCMYITQIILHDVHSFTFDTAINQ